MKRILLPVALVVVLAGVAAAWFMNRAPEFNAAAYGTVVFGVDAPYPPYEMFDANGELTGFEVDLGNRLCEILNLQCTWQVTPWDTIIDDLNADKFDVIMSSMSITKERAQRVAFGEAYYTTPSVFFARKGESIGGYSASQLSGKTVAVQKGTLQEIYMNENYGNDVTVMALDTWPEVSAAFRAAEADVVFTDYPQWEEEFFLEQVYEILGDVVTLGDGVGLAFRFEDDGLRYAMNQGLQALKDNGEYQRIRRKYFLYDIMVD